MPLQMAKMAGRRGIPMPLQMAKTAGRRGILMPLQMTKTAGRRGIPIPLQVAKTVGRRGVPMPLQMVKTAGKRGIPAIWSRALVFFVPLCYTSFIFNGRPAMSVLTKRERARVMPLSIMRLRQRKVVPRMRPFSVGAFFMKGQAHGPAEPQAGPWQNSHDRRILW